MLAVAIKLMAKFLFLGIKHQCDQCEFLGSSIDSLRKHKKYNHSGEEFKCETCHYKTK